MLLLYNIKLYPIYAEVQLFTPSELMNQETAGFWEGFQLCFSQDLPSERFLFTTLSGDYSALKLPSLKTLKLSDLPEASFPFQF